MDPLLGPMITGGASLLGSIFSSSTNAQNSQEQMANNLLMQQNSENFNAQQAQLNRDYQTQMSNTAYQRSSADMKAAGLNPAMMFSSGSAASTPGGATASVGTGSASTPGRTSPFAGLGQAAASAVDTMVKQKQIDLLTNEAAKSTSDAQLADAIKGRQMQENVLHYPEEQRARALTQWQMNHPLVTEGTAVGPSIGKAVGETISPITDVIGSLYGGARQFMRDSAGGYASKLANPFEPSATFSAKQVSGLPSVRQRWKDSGGSDAGWDDFVKQLNSKP